LLQFVARTIEFAWVFAVFCCIRVAVAQSMPCWCSVNAMLVFQNLPHFSHKFCPLQPTPAHKDTGRATIRKSP
jgi:hypothetical protein